MNYSTFLGGLLAFVPMGCGGLDAAQPTVELEVKNGKAWDECSENTCKLDAGEDRIRVVAIYDGLTFAANEQPVAPSLTLRLDGVEVTNPPLMSKAKNRGGYATFESGVFRLPGKAVSVLSATVDGGDGYASTISGFPAVLAEAEVDACPQAPCKFEAGVDTARIAVRAWAEPGSKVAARSILDGEFTNSFEATFIGGSSTAERRAVFNIPAPRVRVGTSPRNWLIEFAADEVEVPTQEFELIAPENDVAVTGCAKQRCQAGVGSVHVTVSTGLEAGLLVTIRSYVNGAYAGKVDGQLTSGGKLGRVAEFDIPVPSIFLESGDIGTWSMEVTGADIAIGSEELVLEAPTFEAKFVGCSTAPCKRNEGSKLTLRAAVPEAFAGRELDARLLVDDVPTGDVLSLTPDVVEGARRFGEVSVTVPKAGEVLTARVYFGDGYVDEAAVTAQ